MKIERLKINHFTNPVGYALEDPTLSYVVTEAKGKKQEIARILLSDKEDFSNVIYDSGERKDIVSTGYKLPISLKPIKRYYWKVFVTDGRE